MRSYGAYFFDIDDTLIYTHKNVIDNIYPRLSRHLGLSYSKSDLLRKSWGGDIHDSLRNSFGKEINVEDVLIEHRKLHREIPSKPIEGVNTILSVLKKHQRFVGLFSASDPPLIEHNVREILKLGEDDVDFILSTVQQNTPKPSPHILFIIMEGYYRFYSERIDLKQILVIGDSIDDFKMCEYVGVDFAAVLTGPTTEEEFIRNGLSSDMIFPGIKDVLCPETDHGVVAIIKNKLNQILLIQEARQGHPYKGCWSGPHGVCKSSDILEEETVCRETFEECGVEVIPVRKLHTRKADTKISTVSFWEAKLPDGVVPSFETCPLEVADIRWFDLDEIQNDKVPLYPGTKSFFRDFYNS